MNTKQRAKPNWLPYEASRRQRGPLLAMRCLAAMVLLAAAILKWRALAMAPPASWPAAAPTPLLITQIVGESLLAIWLLSGLLPRVAWVTTTASFTSFLAVSVWKISRGDVSCGCFGQVAIHPWYTAGLDAAVLVGLCLTRKPTWQSPDTGLIGWQRAGLVGILAAGAFLAVWLKRPVFTKPGSAGELPPAGQIIYLEPADWVGKPLPLLSSINIGDRLSQGRWVIVIHNSQCRRCRQVAPEYDQMARQWAGHPNMPAIALIDVIPDAPPDSEAQSVSSPALVGHIVSRQEWSIITPAILAIENGKVLAVGDHEEPAALWVSRVFNGR